MVPATFLRALPARLEQVRAYRFSILLGGLLAVFLVLPVTSGTQATHRYVGVMGLVLPVFGILASTARRRHLLIAAVLGVLVIASSAGTVSEVMAFGNVEVNLAFCAYVTFVVATAVFRSPRVTGDVLSGAIAIYLLLALTWGLAFAVLEAHQPGSLTVSGSRGLTSARLFYFSGITLMTIGYGDVVPATPAAQALALLAGLSGVAFNTIVLAVLVAKYLMHSGDAGPE